jgi:ribose transport system ATP-binding protein
MQPHAIDLAREGPRVLDVENLCKAFGETQALVSCSFSARPGTVHSILGENGSGKSTLVKTLAGIVVPDGGEIRVGGARVTSFTPLAARKAGIVPVLQEVLVAPNRSVLDNIFLGYDALFRRRISTSARRELARQTLARITHATIALDALAESIPLPQRQLVTIARALIHDPRILILDESTSTLDIHDRQVLFDEIRRRVVGERLVIYISHRLDEVLDLADAVTVLRNGASVATLPRGDLNVRDLLALMSPPAAARLEGAHV